MWKPNETPIGIELTPKGNPMGNPWEQNGEPMGCQLAANGKTRGNPMVFGTEKLIDNHVKFAQARRKKKDATSFNNIKPG